MHGRDLGFPTVLFLLGCCSEVPADSASDLVSTFPSDPTSSKSDCRGPARGSSLLSSHCCQILGRPSWAVLSYRSASVLAFIQRLPALFVLHRTGPVPGSVRWDPADSSCG